MIRIALAALIIVSSCGSQSAGPDPIPEINAEDVVSGYTFLTAETQALQDDDFANPGFLWVDRGERLFESAQGVSQSCSSCHSDRLVGAAATFPKIDPASGALINLEGRINMCRKEHQQADQLPYTSDELLSLTSYTAHQSRGMPINVDTTEQAAKHLSAGEDYFFTRRGQFNLSCAQCHNQSWGQKLRGDTISQGHGNGFPAYRFEWQSMGSLHQRLRDCDTGIRAEPLSYGDQTYIDVELYLAARAAGLKLESPAVRR